MKKVCLTLMFLSCVLIGSAQNYQLFKFETKKVYKDQMQLANTYNLGFDSVISIDNHTIFHPYRDINEENYLNDSCSYYTNFCFRKDKPKWIGDSIVQTGEAYAFRNKWKEPVMLDFSIEGYQKHTFYEDMQQRFSITQAPQSGETIEFDGIIDTVKRFVISHTDLQGAVISSALNGWEIVIGKNLGLINFFRIDSFPKVLSPLSMIGIKSPDAGFYQLLSNDIYDYQAGDEIQYRRWSNWPWQNLYSTQYTHYQILQRTETNESLEYIARKEEFDIDSSFIIVDTVNLSYPKNVVIASVPFDESSSFVLYYKKLSIVDYCGLSLWTFRMSDGSYDYDPGCNLWCDIDMGGPGGWNTIVYVAGVGLYQNSFSAARVEDRSYGVNIVYFEKNGYTCGEKVEGFKQIEVTNNKLLVSPNPASDKFTLKGKFKDSKISVSDIHGNEVIKDLDYSSGMEVNIQHLKAGIYLVSQKDGKSISYAKLVVL